MSDDLDLLERALRDELSPDEERSLADRLKAEPPLARRMVEIARDEAILTEWAAERRALGGESGAPTVRARPLGAIAAVLAIGILGAVAALFWSRGAIEVVSSEGDVRRTPGAVVCGPGGRATLRLSDGSTLDAREKTSIDLATGLHLARGSVAVHVPSKDFRMSTPHARVTVHGTRFEVWVGADSTQLVVTEGRVDVTDAGGSARATVAAGNAATVRAGRPIVVVPVAGSGLLGEYYDAPDLSHPKATRTDATIDFDWGQGPPEPSVRADGFSVRWSGRLLPRSSEPYTFTTLSDDGARLWVDGKLLLDEFRVQTKKEHSATIALEAWRPVEFRMEYLDSEGPATARLFWSSASIPREIVPASAFSLPPASGSGLKGEYFGKDSLEDLRLVRVDPAISFDWGVAAPDPSMPREHFSIRWTGQLEAERTETVTFSAISDDGIRLWVDGRLVIDDWTTRGTAERTGRIELVEGKRYDLRLEYLQIVSTAKVRLLWGSERQPQQVIPPARLFPSP